MLLNVNEIKKIQGIIKFHASTVVEVILLNLKAKHIQLQDKQNFKL